jgi:hypothetical protein
VEDDDERERERVNGRGGDLARLSGPEKQHLDLVFGQHAVSLELALDLIIACESSAAEEAVQEKVERQTYELWLHCRSERIERSPLETSLGERRGRERDGVGGCD